LNQEETSSRKLLGNSKGFGNFDGEMIDDVELFSFGLNENSYLI